MLNTHRFVSEAVECIATVLRAELLPIFQSKRLVGVLVDETTDISVTSQLIVYYRFCDIVTGTERVVFGGIETLPNGTAATVFRTLKHRLAKDDIPFSHIVSFGSDGASVMLGKNEGVATQMLMRNPYMVSFHCVCHREALACEGAAAEIPFLVYTFYPTVEQLGRFFEDSSKRTAAFRSAQLEEDSDPIKIVKSAFTRWLSHDKVTKAMLSAFIPLLKTLLATVGHATASGLFAVVATHEFTYWLLVMRDVLPILGGLSRILQSQAADLSVFEEKLPFVLQLLEEQVHKPGNNVSSYDS
eukprot:Pompholyxophrys_punicea_v1_NODE_149_length_3194_cov_9.758203.p1 type:complete len:300 gc:universal NODE_149_length_3194_cov_9.758203:983-1882(+)